MPTCASEGPPPPAPTEQEQAEHLVVLTDVEKANTPRLYITSSASAEMKPEKGDHKLQTLSWRWQGSCNSTRITPNTCKIYSQLNMECK